LGEVAESFDYGLNAAAADFDGINKYIRITDIDDDNRTFKTESLTSPDCDLSLADNYKLKNGDILFARTGASVGRSYLYRDIDGLVYFAGFLIRARINQNFNAEFVFQNTLTNSYLNFIKITSQRSGQPGVNAQEYESYLLHTPQINEQQKLGEFFRTLDNTITLYKRKLDGLKQLKKAYLQQMFPQEGETVPKIRFAGFKGAWEMRLLGKHTKLITKGTTPENRSGNGLINFIKVENISNGKISPNSKITKEEHEGFLKRSKLEEGDILISIAGTLGRTAIVKADILPANTNQALAIIRGYDFDSNFLFISLHGNAVADYIRKNPTIGAQPNLSLEQIGNLTIWTPKLKEQTAIGNFFHNLDEQITAQQTKLDNLKKLKSAYLQKMFV